jgi:hypothetical protein
MPTRFLLFWSYRHGAHNNYEVFGPKSVTEELQEQVQYYIDEREYPEDDEELVECREEINKVDWNALPPGDNYQVMFPDTTWCVVTRV